jgi:dienelactone hydrolase
VTRTGPAGGGHQDPYAASCSGSSRTDGGPIRAVIGFVLLALALPVAGLAATRQVSFRTDDGRTVTGTLTEAGQRPAAAVVLVPMLGRPRDDWQPLAQRLADAGVTALAIDLPGAVPADGGLEAWSQDVGAAIGYLMTQADVRAGSVGVLGASLGANLAAVAAGRDSRVRALALLSPSLDYRGVRIEGPMRQYGARPALLMASLRDPYAARSVRTLADKAPGPREVHWSDVTAHGTQLLVRDPDLGRALVEWFQRTLG